MEGLIRWWVRNPVAANLLMFIIVTAGWLGLRDIEKEVFPSVQPDIVQVEVIWPGASPKEVEQQVVQRVEEALKNVSNVYRVTSESRESYGSLTVETYPTVNLNAFLDDVKNAVDSITSFPRDMENPRVRRFEWRQEMIRVTVAGEVGEKALTRLANKLRNEMAGLPYISQVDVFGSRREEVTIELSERALRNYGLSFADVSTAIRRDSMNVSVGEVRTRTGDVQLRAQNLADTQTDFEEIVIRQTADGGTVRVADVATVIDGFEQNEILATANGKPAVLLQAKSTDDMQVVKSSQAVKQWLERTRPTLPVGVELELWTDMADTFEDRMNLVANSSILGLILVFLVLIVTLEPKVALWVTVGIGVSFLGAFTLLPANDVSLNMLSTFAFLLVLGIVVDDAIVVGESIHHHVHQRGLKGEEAAIAGAFAVSRPVIFAVLTTIVAFAPWLFLSGVTAQFTRQLSVVISLALLFSLIEAFLILPAHLRNVKSTAPDSKWMKRQKRIADGIVLCREPLPTVPRALSEISIHHRHGVFLAVHGVVGPVHQRLGEVLFLAAGRERGGLYQCELTAGHALQPLDGGVGAVAASRKAAGRGDQRRGGGGSRFREADRGLVYPGAARRCGRDCSAGAARPESAQCAETAERFPIWWGIFPMPMR